jgi:hypothetical protein
MSPGTPTPKLRKDQRKAARAENRRLRERCENCREPFAVHGALPPHTRGEDCLGFRGASL